MNELTLAGIAPEVEEFSELDVSLELVELLLKLETALEFVMLLLELDASLEFAALELEGLGVGSGESLPPPPQAEINPLISRINVSL